MPRRIARPARLPMFGIERPVALWTVTRADIANLERHGVLFMDARDWRTTSRYDTFAKAERAARSLATDYVSADRFSRHAQPVAVIEWRSPTRVPGVFFRRWVGVISTFVSGS